MQESQGSKQAQGDWEHLGEERTVVVGTTLEPLRTPLLVYTIFLGRSDQMHTWLAHSTSASSQSPSHSAPGTPGGPSDKNYHHGYCAVVL